MKQGFTLIEVIVGLFISTIFALGTAYLFSTAKSLRAQNLTQLAMDQVRNSLVECLKSTDGWFHTVKSPLNPDLACLIPPGATGCAAMAAGGRIKNVLGPDGRACIKTMSAGATSISLDDLSTQGVDPLGIPCSLGSDTCLLKIETTWKPVASTCRGSCVNPQVEISLAFTPLAVTGRPLHTAVYNTSFLRGGDRSLNDYTIIVDKRPPGSKGGACTAGAWTRRNLVSGTASVMPTIVASTVNLQSDGRFSLKAGTYFCTVSAPASRVGLHRIRLLNTMTNQVLLNGMNNFSRVAQIATQTSSVAQGLFTLGSDATLAVEHYCQSAGYNQNGHDFRDVALGTPLASAVGGPEVYMTIECFKED